MEERINELVRVSRIRLAQQGIQVTNATTDQAINALTPEDPAPPRNKRERTAFDRAWREAQTAEDRATEAQESSEEAADGATAGGLEPRFRELEERVRLLEQIVTRLEREKQNA